MIPTGEWLRSPKSRLEMYWYLILPGWPAYKSLGIYYFTEDERVRAGKYEPPTYVNELEPGMPRKFKLSDSRDKLRAIKKVFSIHGSQ